MPVEVDDADVTIDVRCCAANIRVADRVVAPKHYRKHAAFGDVAEGECNLVKALLDIGGAEPGNSPGSQRPGFFLCCSPPPCLTTRPRGRRRAGHPPQACIRT